MRFMHKNPFDSSALLLIVVFLCFPGSSNRSFLDRTRSFASNLWSEQIPFVLEKAESLVLSPVCKVDWKETPESHVLMVEVPGMKKGEVKVEVMNEESRVLRVSGKKKREEEKESVKWHMEERSYGEFSRQIKLPENVDLDSVKAKLESGVLFLTLAKLSPEKIKGPREVEIEDGGEKSARKEISLFEVEEEL